MQLIDNNHFCTNSLECLTSKSLLFRNQCIHAKWLVQSPQNLDVESVLLWTSRILDPQNWHVRTVTTGIIVCRMTMKELIEQCRLTISRRRDNQDIFRPQLTRFGKQILESLKQRLRPAIRNPDIGINSVQAFLI